MSKDFKFINLEPQFQRALQGIYDSKNKEIILKKIYSSRKEHLVLGFTMVTEEYNGLYVYTQRETDRQTEIVM